MKITPLPVWLSQQMADPAITSIKMDVNKIVKVAIVKLHYANGTKVQQTHVFDPIEYQFDTVEQRHTLIRQLLDKGVPQKFVAARLGISQSNVSMTKTSAPVKRPNKRMSRETESMNAV